MFGFSINVGVNAKGFSDGLNQVFSKLKGFASNAGGMLVGAFNFSSLGTHLLDTFKKALQDAKDVKFGRFETGIDDAQEFQRVRNAFEASGLGMEAYAKNVAKLAEKMAELKDGGVAAATAQKQLAELGVTIKNVEGKTRHQIFKQIWDDLHEAAREAKVSDDQLNALKKVFGKEGQTLLPLFARASDNSFDQAGIKTDEQLKQLGQVNEVMQENKALAKEAGNTFVAMMMNHLNAVTFGLLPVIRGFAFPKKPPQTQAEQDAQQASERKRRTAKANAAADKALAQAEEQQRREAIAQIEDREQENRDKLLTKEEQLNKLLEKRAEVKQRLRDIDREVGPFQPGEQDLRRARLRERLSELDANEPALRMRDDKRERTKLDLTEAQRLGAQIGGGFNRQQEAARLERPLVEIERHCEAIERLAQRYGLTTTRNGGPFDE